jgi:hypothetical protein
MIHNNFKDYFVRKIEERNGVEFGERGRVDIFGD